MHHHFPSIVCGVIIGSLLTFALKLDGKKSIFVVACAAVISLPFLLTYIIHCPTVSLAGVTTEYPNGYVKGQNLLNHHCNIF